MTSPHINALAPIPTLDFPGLYCTFADQGLPLGENFVRSTNNTVVTQLNAIDKNTAFVTKPAVFVSMDPMKSTVIDYLTQGAAPFASDAFRLSMNPYLVKITAQDDGEVELRRAVTYHAFRILRLQLLGHEKTFGTMHNALITEGLACCAMQSISAERPAFATTLSPQEIRDFAEKIRADKDMPLSAHTYKRFFLNAQPQNPIPNPAFNLGYEITSAYLDASSSSAFDAIKVDPAEMRDAWAMVRFTPRDYRKKLGVFVPAPYRPAYNSQKNAPETTLKAV